MWWLESSHSAPRRRMADEQRVVKVRGIADVVRPGAAWRTTSGLQKPGGSQMWWLESSHSAPRRRMAYYP